MYDNPPPPPDPNALYAYYLHHLLVVLSYFRADIFVQLLSLIPILILLLYLLVSIDLDYTGFVTSRSLGESN